MRKNLHSDPEPIRDHAQPPIEAGPGLDRLSRRLMTAFEVAEFIGCHPETIRRAYLRGLLTSQRFGVRGRRFYPADVHDWIKRGAPTRVMTTRKESRQQRSVYGHQTKVQVPEMQEREEVS
jgi:excisionase family DNA binding protein